MIKLKNGVIVKPRKSGNSMAFSMPKALGLNPNINYLAVVKHTKNGRGVLYIPQHVEADPFAVKGLNHANYVKSMKRNGMALDQGNLGREM